MEFLRKRLPMAIAMAVMLALTGGAALTQSDGTITPAAKQKINVDRVDGKHAINATQNVNRRKKKLMAFNNAGYLPTNIVDGNVATVAALQNPAGAVNEADNPVHWNQVQGVPPAVLMGDTTRSFIAAESGVINPGVSKAWFVDHPVGLEVETTLIPTTVNAWFTETTVSNVANNLYQRITADTVREWVAFINVSAVPSTVKIRVTVWNDSYLSPSAAKSKVKVTFVKNPKKALKRLGLK